MHRTLDRAVMFFMCQRPLRFSDTGASASCESDILYHRDERKHDKAENEHQGYRCSAVRCGPRGLAGHGETRQRTQFHEPKRLEGLDPAWIPSDGLAEVLDPSELVPR